VLNDAPGIAIYELNASCPNTSQAAWSSARPGFALSNFPRAAQPTRRAASDGEAVRNVTSIRLMARSCEDAGGAGDLVVNHVSGLLAIDVETRRPRSRQRDGRVCLGPAIRPIAVRMVHGGSAGTSYPVAGMGGITRAEDAWSLCLAGATAVRWARPASPIRATVRTCQWPAPLVASHGVAG